MIFVISSGRVGTNYLSCLFGSVPGTIGFHEPVPQMNGEFVRMANSLPYAETYGARREAKVPALEAWVQQNPGATYSETSHMFIKTFYDVVCDRFEDVRVVVLRRSLRRTLRSFLSMGLFAGSPSTPVWMTSPNAATAAIRCPFRDDDMDPVDLCIAYLMDIEARASRFREEYPSVPVHEVSLDELNSPAGVRRLFGELGLDPEPALGLIGRRTNLHERTKAEFGLPASLEECDERIAEYLEALALAGIGAPPSLMLEDGL